MRIIRLDKQTVESTTQLDGDISRFTGTDQETGELVKFKLTDQGLANALISLVYRDGFHQMAIADFQIISVEPVRGEWDSPGTAPEEAGS